MENKYSWNNCYPINMVCPSIRLELVFASLLIGKQIIITNLCRKETFLNHLKNYFQTHYLQLFIKYDFVHLFRSCLYVYPCLLFNPSRPDRRVIKGVCGCGRGVSDIISHHNFVSFHLGKTEI